MHQMLAQWPQMATGFKGKQSTQLVMDGALNAFFSMLIWERLIRVLTRWGL